MHSIYLLSSVVLSFTLCATGSAAGFAAKSVKAAAHKGHPASGAVGVQTPGVQIPLAKLQPGAQIPATSKPSWIFVGDRAFFAEGDGLMPVDLKSGKPGTAIAALPQACNGMVSGFNGLWVPLCGEGALAKLDAKTLKPGPKIMTGVASTPGVVVATSDSIWMLTDDKATLTRIDPTQNQVVANIRIAAGCRSLTFGENALWLACPSQNKVLKFNPETNLVEKRIEVSADPQAIVVGEGSVWVYCRKDGKVDRIDPKTDKVAKSIDLGLAGLESKIAGGEGSVWLTSPGFPITRIDPKAETVAQQFTGESGGTAIAAGGGSVWLANASAGSVWKIDPKLILLTLPE